MVLVEDVLYAGVDSTGHRSPLHRRSRRGHPRRRVPGYGALMDPLSAALCGLGAMVIASGTATTSTGALALFAAFAGVHRALRTGASRALIGVPAVVWILGNLWTFVPDRVVASIAPSDSLVRRTPASLAELVLVVALLVLVAIARARLGRGLSTLALVALGLDLLLRVVPTSQVGSPESLVVLLGASETGWRVAGKLFAAVCFFLVGLGSIPVPPLPRRGGAVAGAVGATLLCAVLAGLPHRVHPPGDGALFVLGLLWLTASVLTAVGLGAMARAGASPAAWIGVGLVVLGILALVPALLVFERMDENAYGFMMATPFGLLGVGLGLVGWKGAPLETARRVLGVLLITAFAAGTLAWCGVFLALARITNGMEPWGLARIATEPLAVHGLALWAALLVYLASPPPPPGWRPT